MMLLMPKITVSVLKNSVPPVVSFQIFLLIDGDGARSEG